MRLCPSVCAGSVAGMSVLIIKRGPDTPRLLSILAVRDLIEPHGSLEPFEVAVCASIQEAALSGSLDRLAATLREWLAIALMARGASEGRLVRGAEFEAAVDAWIEAHPEAVRPYDTVQWPRPVSVGEAG